MEGGSGDDEPLTRDPRSFSMSSVCLGFFLLFSYRVAWLQQDPRNFEGTSQPCCPPTAILGFLDSNGFNTSPFDLMTPLLSL